jgi:hypothetical protein
MESFEFLPIRGAHFDLINSSTAETEDTLLITDFQEKIMKIIRGELPQSSLKITQLKKLSESSNYEFVKQPNPLQRKQYKNETR